MAMRIPGGLPGLLYDRILKNLMHNDIRNNNCTNLI